MINLNLESRHREFFGVVCLHEFYHDFITRDLVFEPTRETAEQLQNYALIFKPLPFGFLVTYSPEYAPARLRNTPEKLRFSFKIKCQNKRFMNFSEVPFWPEGVAFHYSNLGGEKADLSYEIPRQVYYYFKQLKVGESEKKLLHLPQHPLVQMRPRKFLINITADEETDGVAYSDIVIRDEGGEDQLKKGVPYKKKFSVANRNVFRQYLGHALGQDNTEGLSDADKEKRIAEKSEEVDKQLAGTKLMAHSIDLKHVPFGRYSLQMGKKRDPIDIYTIEDASEMNFGVVDIYVDTKQNALLNRKAKDDDDLVQPQLFHIYYKARPTYWRYFFMNHKNSKVSPVKVRDENEALAFTAPKDSILEHYGTPTVIFESEAPIILKDRPEHVMWVERMNGKRPMKALRLPTPGMDMVKPIHTDKGTKIYSDVFVYL